MINQAVTPMIIHIAMCLGSDKKFNEEIDEIIIQTLWTKNRKGIKKWAEEWWPRADLATKDHTPSRTF
jgi:hypothetical protein